jgi:hypothetical protein
MHLTLIDRGYPTADAGSLQTFTEAATYGDKLNNGLEILASAFLSNNKKGFFKHFPRLTVQRPASMAGRDWV